MNTTMLLLVCDRTMVRLPLPHRYRALPMNSLEYQPAGYTQGKASRSYVSIYLPLPHNMMPNEEEPVRVTADLVKMTFLCDVQIEHVLNQENHGNLHIISFYVEVPDGMQDAGWSIFVQKSAGGDSNDPLGQVVMDSNVLPTNPCEHA